MAKPRLKVVTPKTTPKTTPQQSREDVFIEEYVKTLSATQAIRATGYKGNHPRQRGWDMLHREDVAVRIQTLMAQRAEQCSVDTQFVIEQTKAIALDPSVPAKDRVKALDLLGRYTQAWTGNTVKTDTNIEVVLGD